MSEMLPEHDHCIVCDDPIDEGQRFCSDLCKDKYEKEMKMQKMRNIVFYIAIIVLLVSFAVTAVFFS